MRIAILGNVGSWYTQDLIRAAAGSHEIVAIDYRQLASSIQLPTPWQTTVHTAEVALNEFDAVLVRSMPPGSLEQVVFRMDALANLVAAGVSVMNPPRAIEVAVDKYLATTRLAAAGLDVPRTITCQTAEQALAAFEALGRDVVVKPLFGSEGRGIERLRDRASARATFEALELRGSVCYLQEFLEHEGCDLRLLVIGEEVLGMRRCNPHDWRTNISRGATGQPLVVTRELSDIAHQAAAAIGAPLAGVDLLPTRDGRLMALEVNAVPGWRALAEVTGQDVAARVLGMLS